LIDHDTYVSLQKKIEQLKNKLTLLDKLIDRYFFFSKLNKKVQSSKLPSKVKDISQRIVNSHKEKIRKLNTSKIIIKKSLLQKLNKRAIKRPKRELPKKKSNLGFKKLRINVNFGDSKKISRVFDFFLFNFSFIYLPAFEFLARFNLSFFQRSLLATVYTLVFIFIAYLTAAYLALLVLYLMKVITNLKFIIAFMKVTFLLGLVIVALLIFYPYYNLKQKESEIDQILPFALVHMSAIASSGINFYHIIKMIAETREYKALAEEFEKIVILTEYTNLDFLRAMEIVADDTPSEKLKEILKSLVYIIRSGGDVEKYLKQKSEEAILSLKIGKEKYIGFLDVFSDLYVILVVAIPLLFVSIIAVMSSFSPSEKMYKFAKFFTFVVIPLLDIGFLLLLNFNKQE